MESGCILGRRPRHWRADARRALLSARAISPHQRGRSGQMDPGIASISASRSIPSLNLRFSQWLVSVLWRLVSTASRSLGKLARRRHRELQSRPFLRFRSSNNTLQDFLILVDLAKRLTKRKGIILMATPTNPTVSRWTLRCLPLAVA